MRDTQRQMKRVLKILDEMQTRSEAHAEALQDLSSDIVLLEDLIEASFYVPLKVKSMKVKPAKAYEIIQALQEEYLATLSIIRFFSALGLQ